MEGQDTVFKCVKCDLEIANCGNKKHLKKPNRKWDHCPYIATKISTLKPHMEKNMVVLLIVKLMTLLQVMGSIEKTC